MGNRSSPCCGSRFRGTRGKLDAKDTKEHRHRPSVEREASLLELWPAGFDPGSKRILHLLRDHGREWILARQSARAEARVGFQSHQRSPGFLQARVDLRRQEAARVHLSSRFSLQRGAGSVELRHPSSIQATLYSPKTFQQLGSLFCARLRDHLQSWLSYWSSTSSTLATLVAARLCLFLGAHLLRGAEESHLQETSRSLGGQRDSILDLERQWCDKRLS